MKITATLWANAGIVLEVCNKKVWIDPFAVQKQPGFSVLSTFMAQKIRRHPSFLRPDACCFTHDHGDHYDPQWADQVQKLYPHMPVFLPEKEWGREHRVQIDDLTIRFLRLPHEGEQYQNVTHYGIMLTVGDKNILISGDCAVAAPELAEILEDQPIDLAILNFPWLTLRKGREFVSKYLPMCPVLLVHLPFEEDDDFGYRMAAARACAQADGRAQPLMDLLQTIEMEL